MLEPYYNFFTKFCDITKFKEFEIDTYLLDLTLVEKELGDCIKPEKKSGMADVAIKWLCR